MQEAQYTNEELLKLLKNNQEQAIDYLFRRDYSYLCMVANRIIKNKTTAEDLVQDVFLAFWKKRHNLKIKSSIRAYLRKATVNKTLNFIRDNKMILEDDSAFAKIAAYEGPSSLMENKEIGLTIDRAIDTLPPKARHVFILSRFEQMSYKEISKQLGISPKTVENHISKSLKSLRLYLKPFLDQLLTLIAFFAFTV